MECDICDRNHDSQRLPFLCAVDARNKVYEPRLNSVRLLLENEALQNEINQLLADATAASQDRRNSLQAQQRMAEDRTTQILAAADKLRNEIKAAREEIKARKAAISRRRADIAAASAGLVEKRVRQQKDVEKSIHMLKYRWTKTADDTASTRAFLCMEAARLYGLKRLKRGTPAHYEYFLGGHPVIDLASMNSLSPELISTSLAHISHILMLTSHYLSIRLPAAITLPHRDYPRPTICNLNNSYKQGEAAFPSSPGTSTPPSEGRIPGSQYVSRPRPLYVDKPLPQLAKEDPATFSYFVEGITLLAYDIAWLCCAQGVPVGDKSFFDDVCHMGRNLYNLLITQQTYGGDRFPVAPPEGGDKDGDAGEQGGQGNWMGRFSHGATYHFLCGTEGSEFAKTFKLPSHMKLTDKLKRKLVTEAAAPDWEVLDDDAWKVEEGPGSDNNSSNKTVKDVLAEGKSDGRHGSSGWMKVKNR